MLEKISGIYQIRNLINNKIYIGSAVNLRKRKMRHFRELKQNKHHSKHLQNSFNKYGEENFIFEIVEIVLESKESILEIEQRYLDFLRPYDEKIGYNLSEIASGISLKGSNNFSYGKFGKDNPKYIKIDKEIIDNILTLYKNHYPIKLILEKFNISGKKFNSILLENNIRRSYRESNLGKNNPAYKKIDIEIQEKIIKLYTQEFKSPKEISTITGINKITQILKENNIELRTSSESIKLSWIKRKN